MVGITINNVAVNAGGTSTGGNIIMNGMGYNTTTNSNDGILITGASAKVETNNNGTINIHGTGGGSSSSNNNYDVALGGNLSTANGAITITGAGGDTGGSGDWTDGVYLSSLNVTGNISITGTGGDAGGSGTWDYGLEIEGAITASSGSTITINATGGNGSSSTNFGIFMGGGSITGNGGNISITGTGGNVSGSSDYGMDIRGSITNTGSGGISLTGIGGGNTNSGSDYGVAIGDAGAPTISTANGTLTITGTGGGAGTGSGNYGVYVGLNAIIKTTGSGALNVTGAVGTGSSNYGVFVRSANSIETTGTGNITVTADTLSLGAASAISSAGTMTLTPHTTGDSVGVNGGSGTIQHTSAILGDITATNGLIIGSTNDTQLLTAAANTWTGNVTLLSGGGIEFSGAQALGSHTLTADATSGNIKLDSGATITSTATSGYPIVLAASGGNFINNSGSNSPLTTGTGGSWAVFSTAAASDTNGASVMSPATSVYSTTYPTTTGESGNTWFYNSAAPTNEGTIDITANGVSASYGDTLGTLAYSCLQGSVACSAAILADLSGALGVTNESSSTVNAGTTLSHANGFDVGSSPFAIIQNTLNWAAGYTGTIDYTSAALTLAAKTLNVTGFAVSGKTYNGSTSATISSNGSLTCGGSISTDGKYITGDTVSIAAGGTAAFGSANAGLETATGALSLTGAQAGDYTLNQPTASATITAAAPTITASNQTQTYGFGGSSASLGTTGFSITGGTLYGSDSVSGVSLATNAGASGSGNYSAGTWNLTPSAATGSGLSNYSITYNTDTNGLAITPKALTVTGLSASNKAYDGTKPPR